MNIVTLTLTPEAFAADPMWTVEEYHQELIRSITAATTDSHVIVGRLGGAEPSSDIGPWLKNNTSWYVWDGSSRYVPETILVGDENYQVTLASGAISLNRTQNLQDKDGVIATTDDVFGGRGSVTLASGDSPEIDWSASNNFSLNMVTDISPTMANSLPGQEISVAIYNATSDKTITWEDTIHWTAGIPVQTLGRGTGPFTATTNGTTDLVSTEAQFTQADVGATVAGTDIVAASTITEVIDSDNATLSTAATGSHSIVDLTITGARGSSDVYLFRNIAGGIYGERFCENA